ncbi:MAG: ribosomal protein S18-alanine N-acetyltransferase [Oscillospiraceae bacterium]|nr:ribosomal protein S18-alanine N-acetyltransferase [Oscillospiraceae bacterium]
MEIRKMQKEDILQLAELEKLCFSDPWSVSAFEYELNNPLSLWLVAVSGETVAGYVGSQTVIDESDMMNIAVAPAFRRQGIAKRLIDSLILGLQERGSHTLTLEVRSSNEPAISLYRQLGFIQVGRRPNYYRNPKEDALILRKEWS